MNEMEDHTMQIHWTDALSEFIQQLTFLAKKVGEILDQEVEANKK